MAASAASASAQPAPAPQPVKDSANDAPESWAEAGEEEAGEEEARPTAEAEPEGEVEPEAEAEPEGEEQPDPYAEAPEFWSAERKAAYAKITDPEVRQAIHENEKERVTATNKKIEEAALSRKSLEEQVSTFTQERDQLVGWWKEMAPKLGQAFQNKWAGVDWQGLAAEDPARYVQAKAAYDQEFGLFQQAAQRHEAEIAAANKRAEQALGKSKAAEHAKLAEKFPDHFGGEKAQKTYDDIAGYLLQQGVPADRVPHIYESFVVGVALKAMLYDKAQAALKAGKPASATQTPTRIPPGPRRGNPQRGEANRQAEQRLRDGQTLSDDDVAALFG